jgi:hypothetical protein
MMSGRRQWLSGHDDQSRFSQRCSGRSKIQFFGTKFLPAMIDEQWKSDIGSFAEGKAI